MRSTAVRSRPGTTARSGWSSRRTSSASGGSSWSRGATTSSASTPASSCPTRTWEASGHLSTFSDPLVECQSCHKRFREDHLQEDHAAKKGIDDPDTVDINESVACPNCGTRNAWTEPRNFNMMLKTYLGVIEDESGLHYLRPETAQGIFLNFANVVTSSRQKPPFGIAQMGKSFRNEITPGNFIFRTREFEQMEMEFFVKPGEDEEWFRYWIEQRTQWYVDLGINPDNLRHYEHPQEKLSHYSKGTTDIEYRFGFSGRDFEELEGIANRTDFDLKQHSEFSGKDLSYYDQAADERYLPYVIEPAAGLTRSLMAFLIDAYTEDEAPNTKGGVDKRVVLKLDPRLAPVKVAVLPLSRNADLSPKAKALAAELRAELERRLRRLRCHRPPLPPPGRDRYAVLRDGRLRDPRRRRGHHPRARHDGPGAGQPRRHHPLVRRAPRRLLIRAMPPRLDLRHCSAGANARWQGGAGRDVRHGGVVLAGARGRSAATARRPPAVTPEPPDAVTCGVPDGARDRAGQRARPRGHGRRGVAPAAGPGGVLELSVDAVRRAADGDFDGLAPATP